MTTVNEQQAHILWNTAGSIGEKLQAVAATRFVQIVEMEFDAETLTDRSVMRKFLLTQCKLAQFDVVESKTLRKGEVYEFGELYDSLDEAFPRALELLKEVWKNDNVPA